MRLRMLIYTLAFQFIATVADAQPTNSDIGSHQKVNVPTIEIFCDFRCPFCARLFNTLLPLAKTENRLLNFRFRHYPFHAGSEELAGFYEAARLQDQSIATALIESLYRYQRSVKSNNIDAVENALVTLHGLDLTRLKRDLRSRDVALAIREDELTAVSASVSQTPTVYINGKLINEEPEKTAHLILAVSQSNAQDDPITGSETCPICSK